MRLSNSKIFLYCLVAYILSIALASFAPDHLVRNGFVWFLCLAVILVVGVAVYQNKKVWLICLFMFFTFLGFWRYSIALPQNTPNKIWFYNNQKISFSGRIIDEPDKRERSQKLKIKVAQVVLGDKKYKVQGKVLVSTDVFLDFEYGDELDLFCNLQAPEEFEGFKYDRYLARWDIFSVCYYPKIIKNKNNRSFQSLTFFYENIFLIKNKIRKIIDDGLEEPEASLGKAIMLGDKRDIPEDLRVSFSRAGLSHIVAISGMHISIISAMVMGGLLYIGIKRKYAFYLATMFLFIYIMLIGLPPSAMRAGMMGFLVLWALHLGRLNKLTNSLLFSATILLLINPKLLRDDIGFQLSFLAVSGIAFVNPIFEQVLEYLKIPKMRGVREIFILTMSAQVFTLPVIAMNFGTISIIAPIANLLVLFVLPFLMTTVILAIIFGGLFPGLAVAWFLPAKILLNYIVMVASIMTNLPYSYFINDKISIFFICLYYVVWSVFLYYCLYIRKNS